MPDIEETALWAWLLFDAGIKTYQAKQLLSLLDDRELTLEAFLSKPSGEISSLGLEVFTPSISLPTGQLNDVQAVRWNERLYPQGLHELTLKLKPAVLFYLGTLDLLSRPIITLETGEITAGARDLLAGVVDLLLDSDHLPAVFTGSPQEKVLLELMAYCDGEALIFVDRGLDHWQPADEVNRHIQNGRLVVLSPMPPNAQSNPALNAVIQRMASTAANRWIVSSDSSLCQTYTDLKRPLLQICADQPPNNNLLPDTVIAADISDVINWLQDSGEAAGQSTSANETPVTEQFPPQVDELPPISAEKALQILELGGIVPEALRQRLVGKQSGID